MLTRLSQWFSFQWKRIKERARKMPTLISSLISDFIPRQTTEFSFNDNNAYRNELIASFRLVGKTRFAQQLITIFSKEIRKARSVAEGRALLEELMAKFERLDRPLEEPYRVLLHEMLADLYESGVEYADGWIAPDGEKAKQYRETSRNDTRVSTLIIQQTNYFYKVALEAKGSKQEEAFDRLHNLALLGHPFAQCKFAHFLENTKQHPDLMFVYYVGAASECRPFFKDEQASYIQAKLRIALLYLRGVYVPRSEQMGWDYIRSVLAHCASEMHELVQQELIGDQLSQTELLTLSLLGLQAVQKTNAPPLSDEKPLGIKIAEQCLYFVEIQATHGGQTLDEAGQAFYDGLCVAIADYYEALAVRCSSVYTYERDGCSQETLLPDASYLDQAADWLERISQGAPYSETVRYRAALHRETASACRQNTLPELNCLEESCHFQAFQTLQKQPRDENAPLVVDIPQQAVFAVSDLLAQREAVKEDRAWIDIDKYFLIDYQQQESLMPKERLEKVANEELREIKPAVRLPAGLEQSLTEHQLMDAVQQLLPKIEAALAQYTDTYYAKLKMKRLDQIQRLKEAITEATLKINGFIIYAEGLIENEIREIVANPGGSAWFSSKLDGLIMALKDVVRDIANGKIKPSKNGVQKHLSFCLAQTNKPSSAETGEETSETWEMAVEERLHKTLKGETETLLKEELTELEEELAEKESTLKEELDEKDSALEAWAQQQEQRNDKLEQRNDKLEQRNDALTLYMKKQTELQELQKSHLTLLQFTLLGMLPPDKRKEFEDMFTALQKQTALSEASLTPLNPPATPTAEPILQKTDQKSLTGDNTGEKPLSFLALKEKMERQNQLRRLIKALSREGFVCSVKQQGLYFSLDVSNSKTNSITPALKQKLTDFAEKLKTIVGPNIKDFAMQDEAITWVALNEQKAQSLCELFSACKLMLASSTQQQSVSEEKTFSP